MQGLVTARQGGENSDRIGGCQPTSGTRTIQQASKDRNAAMQGCACRPNIGYNGAVTLGGGVRPEKKVTQNSRAGISGWSVTADNEGTARTGGTERGLGRDPTGSSWVLSRAFCLSKQ